jgi:16S rRNA (cytidine1402-2'-O)-methyltransferase
MLAGNLYLVPTPIGNLEDITVRALRVLREDAAIIACEDTRQTLKLLSHYDIRKPLISYHQHNEANRTNDILDFLRRGESVALVSDSGTPLISDPGFRVVAAAIAEDFRVIPLPGPSAILTALTASGFSTEQFRFFGFVPQKATARRTMIDQINTEATTCICYEAPHRILETLAVMAEVLGERQIVVARELTKIHEEFLRGSAGQVLDHLEKRGAVKGEFTIVISPAEEKAEELDAVSEIERLQRDTGLSRMEAIKAVAKRMALPKREVYRLVAEGGNNREGKRRDSAQTGQ